MSLFEFLMAIASVVIAIALTEIFGGWGHLLRTHIVPKIDWLHLGWSVVIVLYAIQYWVGIWPYRDVDFTTIYQVWFLIIPTLFIVLVSFAITPDVSPDDNLELREYYMARKSPIFLGLTAFITMAQLADFVILHEPASAIGIGIVAIVAIPAFSENKSIHALVMFANLTFLINNAMATNFIS